MVNEPAQSVDAIDWAALAPERGAEIPDLLRALAQEQPPVDAVRELHEILVFPAAGHLAAPAAVGFLVDAAVGARSADAWPVLNLLHELAVSSAADHLPQRRDAALWRDEVAWVGSTDPAVVVEQYRTWLAEAPDEQHFRRMRNRLDAVTAPGGPELLQAELATYDALRARISDLLPLLRGRDNRSGADSAAEWTAYLLAWFGEDADLIVPGIITAVTEDSSNGWPDPLSAELFALGMVAAPDDGTATVHLGQQLLSRSDEKALAAAVALGLIHGERSPQQCVDVIERVSDTLDALFEAAWPSSVGIEPAELGRLALGALGERVRRVKVATLPDAFESTAGIGQAPLVGDALELVFGPRNTPRKPAEPDAFDDYDADRQEVLWAIADLPDEQWVSADVPADLAAWGFPAEHAEFLTFTGADDEADEDGAEDAAVEPGESGDTAGGR